MFSSGKRIVSALLIFGYWFFLIFRPMNASYTEKQTHFPTSFHFDLPPAQVMHAFAFAGYAFLSLLLAMSTSVQRIAFRPADVDVLFATPVSPRLVLVFRLFRDYLTTLLLPIIPLLFGWRPTAMGLSSLINNLPDPHSAGYVFRAASLAWLLMAMAWVSISYAISLFVNRTDLVSDRNRRVINWLSDNLCRISHLARANHGRIRRTYSRPHSEGGVLHRDRRLYHGDGAATGRLDAVLHRNAWPSCHHRRVCSGRA
jgi:hypothetical protein